ncbi:MAG: SMC-Scp complex subunit ScpB [Chloroflexi bacterium HGW-Chloroflexi-9]|nr:MAG: SMC-Scp complex subunit ScpB [Chloroflexi bacterium HGW-Chloroflexi-9]
MFDDLSQLPALLEALLFVADHPIDSGYLARAVDVSVVTCEKALDLLAEQLRDGSRGIRLQRGPEGVQLTSAPDAAAHVERFLGLEANKRLSTAALETLAIIAYRQPITRGQVDAVRGVSSDGAVATLRARGLIEAAGFAAGPGRPMLFRTTQRFLEHFGLERPGQLPALPDDIDLPAAEIGAQLGLDEAEIIAALTPLPTEEADTSATEGELTPEDVVAAASIEIPADVQALSDAAEHALQAQRDREQAEADADDDAPDDETAEA